LLLLLSIILYRPLGYFFVTEDVLGIDPVSSRMDLSLMSGAKRLDLLAYQATMDERWLAAERLYDLSAGRYYEALKIFPGSSNVACRLAECLTKYARLPTTSNSEQLSLLQRVAGLLQIVLAGQKMNNVRRSQRRPSMKLINLQMNLEMEQMEMKNDSMSSVPSSTTSKVGTTIPPSIFSNSQSGGHWRRKSQGKCYIKILH